MSAVIHNAIFLIQVPLEARRSEDEAKKSLETIEESPSSQEALETEDVDLEKGVEEGGMCGCMSGFRGGVDVF